MKLYIYYLKGTQINGQYSCRPKWFIFRIMRYAAVVRVWRLQIVLRY